ncbi:cyclic nucleotide-binding domain-containing protein [Ottowia pentelensis]|uniref:cyclic nucleotide-binding domain-containing protein n=1 Tax=Ottowia pentelensis TaxID=511108 RepID=UPI0036414C46
MTMLSSLDLIRRVPLFSMLTEAQAVSVADAVVKRRFKRGEAIVEQGRKCDALFILLNGRARVMTADGRGREVILATLRPGDHIGEMSLIDDQPHSATVRAEVQTDVLVLGRTEFARCLPENSSMAYAIMRAWCSACATPTARSSRWRCWTCTAAWRARCWSFRSKTGRASA